MLHEGTRVEDVAAAHAGVEAAKASLAAADQTVDTAVIVAPWIDVPPELERSAALVELPLPSPGELRAVLERASGDVGVLLTDDDAQHLVRVAQGLTRDEAERAFKRALIGWPEDADGARASVETEKRKALRRLFNRNIARRPLILPVILEL